MSGKQSHPQKHYGFANQNQLGKITRPQRIVSMSNNSCDNPVFCKLQKNPVANTDNFGKNIESRVNNVMSLFESKKYQMKDNINPSLGFNLI